MKKYLLWAGFLAMAIPSPRGEAQMDDSDASLAKEPLPPGPLIVTHMPTPARWSIDFKYPAAKTGQAAAQPGQPQPPTAPAGQYRPLHIVVTKTDDTTHEERTFENGQTGEMWSNHDTAAERLPNSPVLVAGFSNGPTGNSFPDFDWISAGNYLGTEMRLGVKCMVFREPQYGIEHSFLGIATAFVSIATRFPVEFNRNSQIRTYTILPPPKGNLIIPEEFLDAGKAMKDRIQKAMPHLAPP